MKSPLARLIVPMLRHLQVPQRMHHAARIIEKLEGFGLAHEGGYGG